MDPCGIFSDDLEGKSCNVIWSGAEGGVGWTVSKVSQNECAISGVISSEGTSPEEGEWNCELQSKPIVDEHSKYESDQQYFRMETIKKVIFF